MVRNRILKYETVEYEGPVAYCKGDQTVKNAENAQANLADTVAHLFTTQYANQQNVLNFIQAQMKPLLDLSQNNNFISPAFEASLRTGASDENAAAFQSAEQGYQNRSFALGGRQYGSGVQNQNLARIGIAGAQQEAGAQQGITNWISQFNQQAKLQNFWNATGTLMGAAGMQNPLGYAGSASSAFGNVGNLGVDFTKTQGPSFLSILGGLGGAALSGLTGGLTGGLGSVAGSIVNNATSQTVPLIDQPVDGSIPLAPAP